MSPLAVLTLLGLVFPHGPMSFVTRPWEPSTGLRERIDATAMEFVGGFELLHFDTRHGGGLSALWLSPDCRRLLAVSDYSQAQENDRRTAESLTLGGWLEAAVDVDGEGRPARLRLQDAGQLRGPLGRVVRKGAESLAWDGETLYLSFDDLPAEGLTPPKPMPPSR